MPFEEKEVATGFRLDKNRKLLQACEKQQAERRHCNSSSFVRAGRFLIERAKNSAKGFSLLLTGFGKSLV